jgi:hypothetical protein
MQYAELTVFESTFLDSSQLTFHNLKGSSVEVATGGSFGGKNMLF